MLKAFPGPKRPYFREELSSFSPKGFLIAVQSVLRTRRKAQSVNKIHISFANDLDIRNRLFPAQAIPARVV
jgi:hypothetical protein